LKGRIAGNGDWIITCIILMIHLRLKTLPLGALVLLLLAPLCTCLGQIQVDTSLSAPQLVKEVLLGEGVAVSNVRYTGPRHAIAYYRDSTKILSITNGLLLTSGNAMPVPGTQPASRGGLGEPGCRTSQTRRHCGRPNPRRGRAGV
jgi:hypothetical protein